MREQIAKWVLLFCLNAGNLCAQDVRHTTGWSLPREPEMVVAMSETPFSIPADGTAEYQCFVVDPGFTEDKWVVAAEVVPGNRSVVQHAMVFVRPPEEEQRSDIGLLTAFLPGQSLFGLPSGAARRIPKGSKLIFQLLYIPTGSAASDVTKVGLVFADSSTVHAEMQTRMVANDPMDTLVANDPMDTLENSNITANRQKTQRSVEQREQDAVRIAQQFFLKMDKNQDGEIRRAEASATFRVFAWRFFDRNDDDRLNWGEVLLQARLSLRP